MKGPKVRDAFVMLFASDIDLAPLDIPASWYVDSAGKTHSQLEHAGSTAVLVESTLLEFLRATRCNMRACSTLVSVAGETAPTMGQCAQHLAEALIAVGDLPHLQGEPVRVILSERRVRQSVADAFVRIAASSPSPEATSGWERYFDAVITDAVEHARAEVRTDGHRQLLVERCIDGLLDHCETMVNLSGLLLGTTLGEPMRSLHDRRSERRESRIVTAEEAAEVAAGIHTLNFNFATQLSFISNDVLLTPEPGVDLHTWVTEIWRQDVLRKALSFADDIEREREFLASDADIHLVAVPANVVHGQYSRPGLSGEVVAAFAISPGACVLLAPGPVAAWMVANFFSKSIVVDPDDCDQAALEILDTLLKDDVAQRDGGTFTLLDSAWRSARLLVNG